MERHTENRPVPQVPLVPVSEITPLPVSGNPLMPVSENPVMPVSQVPLLPVSQIKTEIPYQLEADQDTGREGLPVPQSYFSINNCKDEDVKPSDKVYLPQEYVTDNHYIMKVEPQEYTTDNHCSLRVEPQEYTTYNHYRLKVEPQEYATDNHYRLKVEPQEYTTYNHYRLKVEPSEIIKNVYADSCDQTSVVSNGENQVVTPESYPVPIAPAPSPATNVTVTQSTCKGTNPSGIQNPGLMSGQGPPATSRTEQVGPSEVINSSYPLTIVRNGGNHTVKPGPYHVPIAPAPSPATDVTVTQSTMIISSVSVLQVEPSEVIKNVYAKSRHRTKARQGRPQKPAVKPKSYRYPVPIAPAPSPATLTMTQSTGSGSSRSVSTTSACNGVNQAVLPERYPVPIAHAASPPTDVTLTQHTGANSSGIQYPDLPAEQAPPTITGSEQLSVPATSGEGASCLILPTNVPALSLPTKPKHPSFPCTICQANFNRLEYLEKHKNVHLVPQCDICHKILSCQSALKIHYTIHTREPRFTCCICKEKFLKSGAFQVHMRTHPGAKPFRCDVCLKWFKTAAIRNAHLKRHCHINKEKPYSCHICGSRFLKSYQFTDHMKTHPVEKLFGCSLCPAQFTRKTRLNRHLRTHTGERPSYCSVCGKCFFGVSDLAEHTKRKHTGEKLRR